MSLIRFASLLFISTSVLLAACSPGDGGFTNPPVPGNPAPEYSAHTLSGEELSLKDLSGRVVVLNVWATWCGPCVREMPGLEELYQSYSERGLEVVGASVDRSSAEREVRRFVEDNDIRFTILLDPDQRVMSRFRTLGVPETFLIDSEGVIAYRWIGEFDPTAQSVQDLVESLLEAT